MKKLVIPALLLLATLAQAQVSRPLPFNRSTPPDQIEQTPVLAENHLLTLTIKENDTVKTEFSMTVAGSNFSATFPAVGDSIASFTGTISPEENGSIALKYMLGAEVRIPSEGGAVQARALSFSATVRMRPGQVVQIFKLNGSTCELRLSKPAEAAKSQ